MRLRNKKTGEVVDLSIFGIELSIRKEEQPIYHSLADLNAEWEDYKPKEPLIKDEKIRKCVRLWAEINEFKGKLMYSKSDDYCSFYEADSQEELLFLNRECPNLKHAVKYTIDELCGEESPEPLEPNFIDLDERIKEKAAAEKLYKGENDMHLTEEEE